MMDKDYEIDILFPSFTIAQKEDLKKLLAADEDVPTPSNNIKYANFATQLDILKESLNKNPDHKCLLWILNNFKNINCLSLIFNNKDYEKCFNEVSHIYINIIQTGIKAVQKEEEDLFNLMTRENVQDLKKSDR